MSDLSDVIYEKCARCHFFVDENDAFNGDPTIARYVHLERGDEHDERYFEVTNPHDAEPSGLKATLRTWQLYGPEAMRERFFVGGEGEAFIAPILRNRTRPSWPNPSGTVAGAGEVEQQAEGRTQA